MMRQLTIYDFITEEIREIIKEYLIYHGAKKEYFINEFDHYSQIINEEAKIAITCISPFAPCRVDLSLFNNKTIHTLRIFKDNCIIEKDEYETHDYDILFESLFKDYDEQREILIMEKFLEW